MIQPQAVRDRDINVQGFRRNAPALVGAHDAQGTEVVDAVGELYQNDAHVAAHREQHLAETFGLGDFVGGELEFVEFTHPVHDFGDFDAELLGHFDFGDPRVFQDVVHESGADCGGIKVPLGEDRRYGERVRNVGFARLTELPEVRVIGVAEGALNAFHVAFREVLPAARQKFGGGGDDLRLHHRGVKRQIGVFGNDFIGPSVKVRVVVIFFVALALSRNDRPRSYRDIAEGGIGEIDGCGHDE